MRVVDSMRYTQVTRHLGQVRSQHAAASERALTGRRVNKPSDDPFAASELVQIRSRANRVEAQKSAINLVRGDAEMAEGVLAEAGDLMARANELAVQGASDSATTEQRRLIAVEVRSLREQMLKLANTQGSNGYLFSGSQVDTPPFDAAGVFQGDDLPHNVDIGTGAPARVNASGANAFTVAGGRDVFADLENLAVALDAGNGPAIRGSLDLLKTSHEQIVSERAQSGLFLARLDTSELALERSTLLLAKQDDATGGVDPVEAYSEFVNLGQTLERALGVSREILNLPHLNLS